MLEEVGSSEEEKDTISRGVSEQIQRESHCEELNDWENPKSTVCFLLAGEVLYIQHYSDERG